MHTVVVFFHAREQNTPIIAFFFIEVLISVSDLFYNNNQTTVEVEWRPNCYNTGSRRTKVLMPTNTFFFFKAFWRLRERVIHTKHIKTSPQFRKKTAASEKMPHLFLKKPLTRRTEHDQGHPSQRLLRQLILVSFLVVVRATRPQNEGVFCAVSRGNGGGEGAGAGTL